MPLPSAGAGAKHFDFAPGAGLDGQRGKEVSAMKHRNYKGRELLPLAGLALRFGKGKCLC